MDIQQSLIRMVKTARTAIRVSEQLSAAGHPFALYDEIYGDIADAIYYLIGENAATFSDSATYRILNEDVYSDMHCARLLMLEYLQNSSELQLV